MSHSFPSLNDGLICKSNASDNSCSIFKPLFGDACRHSTLSPQRGLGASQANDAQQDPEDQIRQEGFKRGFEAGRQDACCLTRQEIVPEIKTFAIAFDQLNEALVRIEKISCQKILETALSVAEKILGSAPSFDAEALCSLNVDLKGHMVSSYQLKFRLSCEDMDVLSELMTCENPHWLDCDYIKVDGDPQVQRGSVLPQTGGQPLLPDDTLGALTLSLENKLAEVSTK